jgi:hypothetical protein
MLALIWLLLGSPSTFVRSRVDLAAEVLALRRSKSSATSTTSPWLMESVREEVAELERRTGVSREGVLGRVWSVTFRAYRPKR